MESKTEITFEELKDKPLADNVIDQMADSEEERKDIILMLKAVSGPQAQLIRRMLDTLKVESIVLDLDELAKMEDQG